MAIERLALAVSRREGRGKSVTRKIRVTGQVPGVVYGSGIEPTPIVMDGLALAKVLRGGANALIDLSGEKSVEGKPVLVKEIQRDPLSRRVVHCDLYAVNLKARIDLEIPLHFVGTPRGVALDGGVLEPLLRTLELSCMPLAIPESIDVDVTNLGIGDAIHVRDVVLPADVVCKTDLEVTVIHVVAPRLEEIAAPAAAAEGEAAAGEAAPAEGAAAAPAAGGAKAEGGAGGKSRE
jgi:large subunit ribosomal protein L25